MQAEPDITLKELAAALAETNGVDVQLSSLHRALERAGLSYKKGLIASERDRPALRQARRDWIMRRQPRIRQEPHRLVFIDETAVKTNLTRLPTVFSKNPDRLLTTDMSRKVMAAILAHPEVKPLLSDEHFSVDGTLVKAWASMKSFQPKDSPPPDPDDDPGGPPQPPSQEPASAIDQQPRQPETRPMSDTPRQPRNAEVDFRGDKRSNETHASVTDPDARLYKKAPQRCYASWAIS